MKVNGGNVEHDVACVSLEFLQCHNVQILPWPARSPDLNPIEQCLDFFIACIMSTSFVIKL